MIWERVGREGETVIMLERGWKEDKEREREIVKAYFQQSIIRIRTITSYASHVARSKT